MTAIQCCLLQAIRSYDGKVRKGVFRCDQKRPHPSQQEIIILYLLSESPKLINNQWNLHQN